MREKRAMPNVISDRQMFKAAHDGKGEQALYTGLFGLLTLGCSFTLYLGVIESDVGAIAYSILGLIFFGLGGYFVIFGIGKAKKYRPGKTWSAWRKDGAWHQRLAKIVFISVPCVALVVLIIAPESAMRWIWGVPLILVSTYVFLKALPHHEDVDFSANQYLIDALGIDLNEKVLVSYQNFTSENVKRGSSVVAVTPLHIFYAGFDGTHWIKLKRSLREISGIGITAKDEQAVVLKLAFDDKTSATIKLELYERLTSSPALVVKRLLEALDSCLLGSSIHGAGNKRRRQIVQPADHNLAKEKVSGINAKSIRDSGRRIDLSPAILGALERATEVAPGRKLEL